MFGFVVLTGDITVRKQLTPEKFQECHDSVLANHNKLQDRQANLKTTPKPQTNYRCFCGLVFSRLIGQFLATQ